VLPEPADSSDALLDQDGLLEKMKGNGCIARQYLHRWVSG
jgi:hypothetical protein